MPTVGAFLTIGPILGPLIGSVLVQSVLGWRWIANVVAIASFFIAVFTFPFLPETYTPLLLARRAERMRHMTRNWAYRSKSEEAQSSIGDFAERYLLRPARMLTLEPILLMMTLYVSVSFGKSSPLSSAMNRNQLTSCRTVVQLLPGIPNIVHSGARLGPDDCQSSADLHPRGCHYRRSTTFVYDQLQMGTERQRRTTSGDKTLAHDGRRRLASSWNVPLRLDKLRYHESLASNLVRNSHWLRYPLDQHAGHELHHRLLQDLCELGHSCQHLLEILVRCWISDLSVSVAIAALIKHDTNPFTRTSMYAAIGVKWGTTILALLAVAMIPIPILFYYFGAKIRAKSKWQPPL